MLSKGDSLDRYVIEAVLGEGGVATVYLAYDPRLRRRIALKLVQPLGEGSIDDAPERLVREARAVAALSHPNIVSVFDVGETAEGPFIAMELVRGRTLRTQIDQGPDVSAARKVRWLVDIARALAAAHAQGIVHRDVKPGNVMIGDDGSVKVLDFGVARSMAIPQPLAERPPASLPAGESATLTREGTVVGTPRYMAPEQLRGEPVDGRTDQFAWGLIAYELFAGTHPWAALEDPIAMWGEMTLNPPAPLGTALPPGFEPVDGVVARALDTSAARRFGAMDDVILALEGLAEVRSDSIVPSPRTPMDSSPSASRARLDSFPSAPRGGRESYPSAPRGSYDSIRPPTPRSLIERAPTPEGAPAPLQPTPRTSGLPATLAASAGPPPPDEAATIVDRPIAHPAQRGSRWRTAAIAVGAISSISLLGLASRRALSPGVSVPPPARSVRPAASMMATGAHRLTFGGGCDEFPNFAPSGDAVVFEGPDESKHDGVVRVRVADSPAGAESSKTVVPGGPHLLSIAPRYSPRGDRVAYLRVAPDQVGTYVAPVDGGQAPRLLAAGGPTRPAWSLDGRGVWAAGTGAVVEYDADTGAALRSVKIPGSLPGHTLPLADGRLVATFQPMAHSPLEGLAILSENGDPVWLVRDEIEEVLSLAPDGKSVITARVTPMNTDELIRVPLDGGPIESLAAMGLPVGKGLDLSSDGRKVTWSSCRAVARVTEIGESSFGASVADEESDPVSVASVPGRNALVVLSLRSGAQAPWLVDLNGHAPPRMLDNGSVFPIGVAVSGDGASFVLATADQGLYLGRIAGDAPLRRLTEQPGDNSPSFRYGDHEVLFTRNDPGGTPRILRVPVEGGEATPLFEPGSSDGWASPASDMVVYVRANDAETESLVLWDGRTGKTRLLAPERARAHFRSPRFSSDGQRLVAIAANHELLEIDVPTGKVFHDFVTDTDVVSSPTYTPHGLLAVHVSWQGNIWLANLGEPLPPSR